MEKPKQGSDGIISAGDLILLDWELRRGGNGDKAERLKEMEPELHQYIDFHIKEMAGGLVLQGVESALAAQMANQMMSLAITILEATNRASYRIWSQTLKDTPLGRLRSLFYAPGEGESELFPHGPKSP